MSDLKVQDDGNQLSTENFLVPFEQNLLFTGRKEFLELLKQKLFDRTPKKLNHRVALYGMGGIGKTQTALEYVYSNRDTYKRIYWMTAVDQASLLFGYQKIAIKSGLKNLLDLNPVEIVEGVLSWLCQEQSWLVVIDNLDDINIATSFLPQMGPRQHTIITTRNPNSRGIPAEGLEVPLLDASDSVELLSTMSNIIIIPNSIESEQAAQIVHELGYLPLGIEQAAAYVREVSGNFASFLDDYHINHTHVYEWIGQGNRTYAHSIATTWSMSFNIVRSNHRQAAQLFQLLSFLNPDGVLIDFLQAGVKALPDDLQALVSSRIDMSKALIELEKFSLLKWNRLTKTLLVHRLVQTAVRDEMSDEDSHLLRTTVVDLCNQSFPQEWTIENRKICRDYVGQVMEPLLALESVRTEKLASVMYLVGWFLREDGKISDSERLARQAVEINTEILSEDHPSMLNAMDNLALTYHAQGKTAEAAKLHERVLEKRKCIQGDDHPNTLMTMGNLAETYRAQGKTAEAAALQEWVLEKHKRILGDDHPDTLMTMGNLALTDRAQGRGGGGGGRAG